MSIEQMISQITFNLHVLKVNIYFEKKTRYWETEYRFTEQVDCYFFQESGTSCNILLGSKSTKEHLFNKELK